MALFGISKKEKELIEKIKQQEIEIEHLKSLACPEQKLLDELHKKIQEVENQIKEEKTNYNNLLLNENEIKNKIKHQEQLKQENDKMISKQIQNIEENDLELEIQTVALYKPTFEFANSDLYKDELKKVRDEQKKQATSGTACVSTGSKYWVVNNSSDQGIKMIKALMKLLLRAFNTECDNIVDNVKVSNYERCITRMEKARDTISKCTSIMEIRISDEYLNLKKKELALALDFAQKKQEEKERLKELRAQEREEAKAQKEIEEARKKLEKEQTHYQNALKSIISQLEKNPDNPDLIAKKEELENDIADTNKAIENVDYREANRRAGYVYIISNIGAFGKDIYKIGMTRRLDPMDRIDELGSASVPFNFDVHALIFTEDAPKLESALHKAFDDKKVNKINTRREFFNVSLDEIKKVVRENFDKTVEWIDFPEAEQYRQSISGGLKARKNISKINSNINETDFHEEHEPNTANVTPEPPSISKIINEFKNILEPIVDEFSIIEEDNNEYCKLHMYTSQNRKIGIVKISKSDFTMQLRKLGNPESYTLKSIEDIKNYINLASSKLS